MIKGLILGVLLGVILIFGGAYLYFATGRAPVATDSPEMPMEHKLAHIAQDAYLDKLPHPNSPVPADEKNFLEAATTYKEHCAVCHGLPDGNRTAIADGMFPKPPHLFHGTGVTDDEAWETYWKINGGIRMTGMPGFKNHLSETQMWQLAVLLKNADKIPATVKVRLVTPEIGSLQTLPAPAVSGAPITSPAPAAATHSDHDHR
jgi:thiosulfate dehydrogenase